VRLGLKVRAGRARFSAGSTPAACAHRSTTYYYDEVTLDPRYEQTLPAGEAARNINK
jgi:hypothetical protein